MAFDERVTLTLKLLILTLSLTAKGFQIHMSNMDKKADLVEKVFGAKRLW